MEQKKSAQANLERKRTTGFVLGLVVALSALFVALQWNSEESDYDIDEALLDEMAEELMIQPWEEEKDLMPMPEMVVQPTVADQIKVVETPPKPLEKSEDPLISQATVDAEEFVPEEPEPLEQTDGEDRPIDVRIVEQLPEFPGGMTMFVQWLTKNLKYPETARSQKIQGRVVVSFIINKDGSISEMKIARSVHSSLDGEAMRVMRMMPRWKPGVQNNEPCRTMMAIPIVFQL
ncbi:MAG: energy transducer TonB [Prevotella sp.]|nr:energy transducer TonB [Prevotella sp.]